MLCRMASDDRLISSHEASRMLGIDRSTLLRRVRQGKIPAAEKWDGKTGPYRFAYATIARIVAERRAA
jgi:predicted site-specific integrase-resolvase